jgi:hypothetical protein
VDFEWNTTFHLEMAASYLQDILDQVRELQVKVDQLTARSAESGGAPSETIDGGSHDLAPVNQHC